MHRSQGFDADRALVWGCFILVYLLLGWLVSRPQAQRIPDRHDEALRVIWIERARPQVEAMPVAQAKPGTSAVPDSSPEDAQSHVPESAPDTPEDIPSRPLSAVFIDQGRAFARERAPVGDFTPDPLSAPKPLQVESRADRFAMREPITPASVVAGIGALFGGSGYTTDPCPRIRDNIRNLATGGASESLEEELRRDRRLCR